MRHSYVQNPVVLHTEESREKVGMGNVLHSVVIAKSGKILNCHLTLDLETLQNARL